MEVRWLGWAGVEITAGGERLVIDLLGDASGVVAALGPAAADVPLPQLSPAQAGESVAGLVTHLHRDHTDAGALAVALRPGAAVLHPAVPDASADENLWLVQADQELDEHGLRRETIEPWLQRTVGPFSVTALPAVDGIGDPQVSWLVEADGKRVVHLGDTMFHGYWWRMAHRYGPFDLVMAPINGAVVCYPHCQPCSSLPADLAPGDAALAGHLLQARRVVPIHYDGFEIDPYYVQAPRALDQFLEAARGYDYSPEPLATGETLAL